MKVRHLILMLLKASGGKVDSKTKIQKEIYFISLLLNKNLGFKAHYYGPYSLEVEQGLDELIGAGFVDVERTIRGKVKRYDFSLAESGKRLAETLPERNPDEDSVIRGSVENLRNMGYLSLSIAAKAHFILDKEGKPLTKDQIVEKARDFGWNINEKDINTAVEILRNLNFVKEE